MSYSAILWVMVGLCLYAALSHLQIGLRRPIDHTHSLFGLVALCVAFATTANIELTSSQTPAQYLVAARHSTTAIPILFALFPWFVYAYGMQTRRWIPTLLSSTALAALIFNFSLPYTLMLARPPTLGTTRTAWGETITRALTPPTEFIPIIWILYGLTIIYVLFSGGHLYRHGPARRSLNFSVSMLPLVAALTINILVGLGVMRFMFVASFGFVAMIMLMSVSLGGEWRRTSKKLQVLLDHVPAVVYVKRLDGSYMFINRQFEVLYGLPARTVIGSSDLDLFSDARATQHQESEQAALNNKQPVASEEIVRVATDTDTRTYSWLHFALTDGRGIAYAVCGISTDITERKVAADTLRALAASLDRRVTRRTDQLANLNRELEAFAYSVSHDLRAPLTAVNGFAELLLREYAPKLDQTAQRYLHRIREGSLKMGSLIQDLLNLSRVTQQVVQRERVDIVALANDALKSLREAQPTRHVVLRAPASLVVNADARLLCIGITNLIDNAWKYTSKTDDAYVDIGVLERDDEKIYFVKDNGAGFDMKYAERLFRPFVRLHSEQEFPGTGIGLATVARIINRHGGRLWAEASPQQGTTIFFTLPSADEEHEEQTSEQETVT